MPVRLEHTGNAVPTTLTASITSAATTLTVAAATGWPTGTVGPFVATLDRGTGSEEKVLITSRTGTVLTVQTRGYDGTAATAHGPNATVEHTFSATEADQANAAAVALGTLPPGATILTTTGTQAVTNKDLTSPSNTLPAPAGMVTLTGVQAVTNKDLTSPTNTFPALSASLVTLTGTQAVTNKDLSSATNTLPASLPRGVLGYAQITANQTSITNTDIVGLTVTVAVATGRRIRISAFAPSVSATNSCLIKIMEGATQLTAASVRTTDTAFPGGGTAWFVTTPSAGSHTYKVNMETNTGSGFFGASTTFPAFLLVEDIGV